MTLKNLAFFILLSNFFIPTIFCMDIVIDDDPKTMFCQSVCSYLDNDSAPELQRLAMQLHKLGISIMDFSMNTLGDTPPHYAVRNSKAKCLKMLLTFNPVKNALDQTNQNGETIFELAAQSTNQEIRNLCFNNNVLKYRYIDARIRNLSLHDLTQNKLEQ